MPQNCDFPKVKKQEFLKTLEKNVTWTKKLAFLPPKNRDFETKLAVRFIT